MGKGLKKRYAPPALEIIDGVMTDKSQDADWLRARYFEQTAEIARLTAECKERNQALEACRIKLNKLFDATGGVYHGGMEHSQLIAWIKRLADSASTQQELERDGRCRFNCRTPREVFDAGVVCGKQNTDPDKGWEKVRGRQG